MWPHTRKWGCSVYWSTAIQTLFSSIPNWYCRELFLWATNFANFRPNRKNKNGEIHGCTIIISGWDSYTLLGVVETHIVCWCRAFLEIVAVLQEGYNVGVNSHTRTFACGVSGLAHADKNGCGKSFDAWFVKFRCVKYEFAKFVAHEKKAPYGT